MVRRRRFAVASLVAELRGARLQYLQHMGSVVPAPRPPSTGSTAVADGLSCSVACGIFPDQGSPALTGGFLATGPPGKS